MEELKQKLSSGSLTFGILGLIFCSTGLLGLIFSAIGRSKAKKYAEEAGELTGKAKAGKVLATIGLVFSIINLVCWAIIIIACSASPSFRQSLMQTYGL